MWNKAFSHGSIIEQIDEEHSVQHWVYDLGKKNLLCCFFLCSVPFLFSSFFLSFSHFLLLFCSLNEKMKMKEKKKKNMEKDWAEVKNKKKKQTENKMVQKRTVQFTIRKLKQQKNPTISFFYFFCSAFVFFFQLFQRKNEKTNNSSFYFLFSFRKLCIQKRLCCFEKSERDERWKIDYC